MVIIRSKLTLSKATQLGTSGKTNDVDYLMRQLSTDAPIAVCKLIDYAIGLINTHEGIERLKFYLFEGTEIQRSYSALYFKRNEITEVLDEAVNKNCINSDFAYCR